MGGTTLVEELLHEAASCDSDCDCSMGGCSLCLRAARLRARAEKVRGLERPACRGSCDHPGCDLYRALTGPLNPHGPIGRGWGERYKTNNERDDIMSDDATTAAKDEKRMKMEARLELQEQAQEANARNALAAAGTYLERIAEDRAEVLARTRAHEARAREDAEAGARHASWLAAIDRNTAALEHIAAAIEKRP